MTRLPAQRQSENTLPGLFLVFVNNLDKREASKPVNIHNATKAVEYISISPPQSRVQLAGQVLVTDEEHLDVCY